MACINYDLLLTETIWFMNNYCLEPCNIYKQWYTKWAMWCVALPMVVWVLMKKKKKNYTNINNSINKTIKNKPNILDF